MPVFILHMVMKPLIDLLFEVLLAILRKKVADTKSDVDDHLVDIVEKEQDSLKALLRQGAKELHPEKKKTPLKGIWKSIGRRR